jgi:hypothetical protein
MLTKYATTVKKLKREKIFFWFEKIIVVLFLVGYTLSSYFCMNNITLLVGFIAMSIVIGRLMERTIEKISFFEKELKLSTSFY